MAEQRDRRGEPPDGHDELTIGSVLFSLGLFRAGAAGVTVWLARTPGRCPITEPGGCRSMEIYGWLGFGEGGLMVGTGLTYMIIGGVRRSRHRRWQQGWQGSTHEMSRRWSNWSSPGRLELGPWVIQSGLPGPATPLDVAGGGGQLRLRF
jgi:hypothetical protein